MSKLPSPFQRENFTSPTVTRQSSSPGFLMLTRPPHASTIGPDGRGRSMGRANYKSNYRGGNFQTHNINKSFDNYRSNPNYESWTNNRFNYSPNDHFNKSRSFAGSPSFQSTPNSHFHKHRGGRSPFYHRNSYSGSDKKSFNKTPLKDIPIEKFISADMVTDPWESMKCDLQYEATTDVSSSVVGAKSLNSFNSETVNSLDTSFVINKIDETSNSLFESSVISPIRTNSPIHPSSISSSEKDTGTESDN